MVEKNEELDHSSGDESNRGTPDVEQLEEAIVEAIDKINNIPYFDIKTASSEQLKATLIPILKNARTRVSQLKHLYKSIDGVRNEIIEPVNRIIKETAEPGLRISQWGVRVGWIGIVLTFVTILVGQLIPAFTRLINKSEPQTVEVSINNLASKTFAPAKVGELSALIRGEKTQIYFSELHILASQQTNKLEAILRDSENPDSQKIINIRSELSSLLSNNRDRNLDGDLVSRIIYASILCSRALNEWDAILDLTQFAQENALSETFFGAALGLYKAEAYYRVGSRNEALSVFESLQTLADDAKKLVVLSPDLLEMEPIETIVIRRINEIELATNLKNGYFWLYDSKKVGHDKDLKRKLDELGYNATARGNWYKEFLFPYLYYRNRSIANSGTLKLIVKQLEITNLKTLHYSQTDAESVKAAFNGNDDLDFLIVL